MSPIGFVVSRRGYPRTGRVLPGSSQVRGRAQQMEFTVRFERTAVAAMAGALALGAFGGVGIAQAKPHGPDPCAPGWCDGGPPGHNRFGPPGQVMNGNPV